MLLLRWLLPAGVAGMGGSSSGCTYHSVCLCPSLRVPALGQALPTRHANRSRQVTTGRQSQTRCRTRWMTACSGGILVPDGVRDTICPRWWATCLHSYDKLMTARRRRIRGWKAERSCDCRVSTHPVCMYIHTYIHTYIHGLYSSLIMCLRHVALHLVHGRQRLLQQPQRLDRARSHLDRLLRLAQQAREAVPAPFRHKYRYRYRYRNT
jgi:hypothetical protein